MMKLKELVKPKLIFYIPRGLGYPSMETADKVYIKVKDLRTNQSFVDSSIVNMYKKQIERTGKFPVIKVSKSKSGNWIVRDGTHRVNALKKLGYNNEKILAFRIDRYG